MAASRRAFCIHGHFYQPSREDPLTGRVPVEEGAAPYENWNERILDHCYAPNAVLQNFEKISFNLGPTLFNWLDMRDPHTAALIVEQDMRNVRRYGVGNAMAQPYHHTILPLSTRTDKLTQVRWGIADFERRFGHRPGGMWLPEAAVDDETLDVLAECGIEFTILAPWQADTPHLDITHPYRVELSSGRSIAVFFYDADCSTRISFDPLSTENADEFLARVIQPRFNAGDQPQILLAASDGELYGHHQPFRDKFLQRLMRGAAETSDIEATFPALWLLQNPAQETIRIRQNTSWSCHHGVSRWKETCGCTPHGDWKTHLRKALDTLAVDIDQQYVEICSPLVYTPWELRHEYIRVVNGEISVEGLIQLYARRELTNEEMRAVDMLLAAQFERQRMFTSCGWFFEDFDRIEPRNVVAYAAQAVWLTYLVSRKDLTLRARELFSTVRSWRTGLHGDRVFDERLARAQAMRRKLETEAVVPA